MAKVIRIIMVVVIIAVGLGVIGCGTTTGTAPEGSVGSAAPDFELQALDGSIVSLSGLRGSPVMLNFWASWCGPCRSEMPFIQDVFTSEKWSNQGLVILAVDVGESADTVRQFTGTYGLTFTVLLDSNQDTARDYNLRGLPSTFFIDENGIIKDMNLGAFISVAEIEQRLVNSILEDD